MLLAEDNRSTAITPDGQQFLDSQYVDALANRLRVHQYVQDHPEVLEGKIERPLVILGMPRTGTTVASYLLDQDPQRRSLLNWEAGDSVPPATTATLRTDPRCLAKLEGLKALAKMMEEAGQGFPHWEDADGPTECIFVQNQDFKALVWDSYSPTGAYSDWLLQCDMTSAYQYEKRVLQVLQSQAPGTWSLKMPSHAVHIETLLATFPDVRMVWAHRDPYKATGSLCSIVITGKYMVVGDNNVDLAEIGRTSVKQMQAHVGRALRARADRRRPVLRPALRELGARSHRRDAQALRVGGRRSHPRRRGAHGAVVGGEPAGPLRYTRVLARGVRPHQRSARTGLRRLPGRLRHRDGRVNA